MKNYNINIIVFLLLLLIGVRINGQGLSIGSGTIFSLGSSTLSLSGNWNNSGTFTAGSGTVVLNGASGNQTITNSSGETFYNLTVNKAADDVQLANNITVNGTLTCTSGDLDLNGKILTLESSAVLHESSDATVKGTSGYITATRNINAPSAENVAGLGAVITSSSNLGSTTITRGHAVQTNGGSNSVKRYFDITPTNNSGLNATLVFNYDESELNSLTENDLQLFKSTNSGANWQKLTETLDATANTLTTSGVDAFSRYTAAAEFNTLPTGSNNSITIKEDSDKSFLANDFEFNDSDNDSFTGIKVTTLETKGELKYNGSDVTLNMNCPDVTKLIYSPVDGESGSNYATFKFKVYDSTDYSSSEYTMTINVTGSNDAPVLSSIETVDLHYSEGESAKEISNSIIITDEDDANLESASVGIITNYKSAEDVLSFTNQNGITGSWSSTTGVMSLSGSSSVANYQAALRSIKYNNKSSKPDTSSKTISFIVNDGEEESNTLTRNIKIVSVNSKPVLHAISDKAINEDSSMTIILSASDEEADSISYTASCDTNAVAINVADTTLTITPSANWYGETNISVFASDGKDKDTTTFKFTVNPVNDAPVLDSISSKTTNEDIPLTIILSATDAESDSIIYSALSDTSAVTVSVKDTVLTMTSKKDWNGNANISIITSDGKDSNTTIFKLTVIPVNDAPALSNINTAALSYVLKTGELNIVDSLEISDVDDKNIKSASIVFSGNYKKVEDKLLFNEANGIIGEWNEETGVLTLSGSAAISDYQSAIKNIRYKNTYLTPTKLTREITITVLDSELVSNGLSRKIIVAGKTSAPVLSKIESDTIDFKKSDAEILLTNTIEVTDEDNEYLYEGSVSIDDGFLADEDLLEFENTETITGNYNSAEGKLKLSGQATIEEYQSILRTIKYKNTKGMQAATSLKGISFTVRDGEWASNKVTRNIKIVSPLKAPTNLVIELNTNWEVVLNWQDNSDNEAGFEITRAGNNELVKDSVGENTTTYIDKNTLEGFVYEYCVLAHLNEAKSDTSDDNRKSISIPLKPPTDLKAEINPEGTINLTWMDNSSAEKKYIVERSEETQNNFTEIKSCGEDSCCYCDKNIVNNRKYYYRVYALSSMIASEYSNVVEATGIVTDVDEELAGIPKEHALYNNYPNPFNPATVIRYDLPVESNVKLCVYNILGEEVAVLKNSVQPAGKYIVNWNASSVSSGIYFYRIISNATNGTGNFVKVMKMLLVK